MSPKLDSWFLLLPAHSPCSLPHFRLCQLPSFICSGQNLWNPPWLFSFKPLPNKLGNLVGSTFKVNPESDWPLFPTRTSPQGQDTHPHWSRYWNNFLTDLTASPLTDYSQHRNQSDLCRVHVMLYQMFVQNSLMPPPHENHSLYSNSLSPSIYLSALFSFPHFFFSHSGLSAVPWTKPAYFFLRVLTFAALFLRNPLPPK